ncbi:hypothetical protein C4J87_1513 [Pseudomonas sp. R1-43-08]|nr:hypothetical protein C4J87_1513 [Pseudomonas sp. R1-43-08]
MGTIPDGIIIRFHTICDSQCPIPLKLSNFMCVKTFINISN